MSQSTANWESFALPGQDLLEPVRAILEVLVVFLEVLKTLLNAVKSLLILFGNAIIALVEALITLILTLFTALKQTGLYVWWDIPNLTIDPNLNRHIGGHVAFLQRFKASCVDVRDPNRPQPIAGATESGFVLLVVDEDTPVKLLRLITSMMYFFGQEFKAPHYKAPTNVKVLPVGAKGDPVLSLVDVFAQQPASLVIEWSLPGKQASGDAGFRPVFADFARELIPPSFVIEKSAVNPNVLIDSSQLNTASAAGLVTQNAPTNFEKNGQPGQPTFKITKIGDFWNDPFIKFQKYIAVNPSANAGTFFVGQLGTFRYIDNDVKPGQTYWYRVRATSADLTINADGSVTFPAPTTNPITGRPFIAYPGGNPTAMVGRASPIHSQTVPLYPSASFDVIANLKALFETAFSLNFHQPLPQGALFSQNGQPIPPTSVLDIGLGSLTQQAGSLTGFAAVPILGAAAGTGAVAADFSANAATGAFPEAPWQTYAVVSNATRLAIIVGGALLTSNNAPAFQKYMTSGFPKSPAPALFNTPGTTSGQPTNLSQFVMNFTTVSTDATVMATALSNYGFLFVDPGTRLNILAAINYVKTFTLGGVPPDWKTVELLRDIVPWSGQLLYDLIAKIQAMMTAFQGIMQEITAFINLIERKINAMEQFIEYLVSILDFLLALELGFFVLFLPETSGDITSWFSAVDNAGGTPPTSGPNGYTAGVALAYIAPDVSAFKAAFELIF
jgi:hypothetical protein